MQFNKQEFKNFRNDLEEALKEIEKKYKVKVHAGSIGYSDLDFNLKLKVTKDEEGLDIEKENFIKHCEMYGFEKEQYKAQFTLQGKVFELIGFNLKSPKNGCSILDTTNGKIYKTSEETVKRALKAI